MHYTIQLNSMISVDEIIAATRQNYMEKIGVIRLFDNNLKNEKGRLGVKF